VAVGLAVGARHGTVAGVAAGACVIALTELAARRPHWAVSFLAFAYAAAPRLDAQLRAEDFATLGLLLAALRTRRPFATPLDRPIAIWLLAIGLSLSVGLLSGTIARPAMGAFTALKILEYLIAFYAAVRLRARLEPALFLALMWLVLWGAVESWTTNGRIFDRPPYKAEANHVGGFAALCAAWSYGRISERSTPRDWTLLAASVGLAALTQSRIALLALGVVSVLQLFRARVRIPAVLILLLGALALLGPLKPRWTEAPREWRTFRRTEARVAEGFPPVFSYTRNRFEVWALLADDFARYPIVGTGPGSRDRVLYENAGAMIACELGAVGIGAFLLLLVAIFLHARVSWGAISATLAMLVLGLASISFFLAREAGPWWMMVGSALAGYTPRDGESSLVDPADSAGA